MKIVFSLILILHGLIHLMGFAKAFNLATIEELTTGISKVAGIVWLIVTGLFLATLVAFLADKNWWWFIALIAIVSSQLLIIFYWNDAKFGSVANILILIPTSIACATYFFSNSVKQDREVMISQISNEIDSNHRNSIVDLPLPVQRWLAATGVTGNSIPKQVNVTQSLQMKMEVDQEQWLTAHATQLFTPTSPAFNWEVSLQMNKIIPVVGRDEFYKGKGGMLIKLFGIYPLVNVADNKKLNEAALQRYLAEITWFPQAALSEFIKWEPINNQSAKATINYQGTSATGTFKFDDAGNFVSFKTMRYKGVEEGDEKMEWIVNAIDYHTFNNIKVPSKLEAEWNLPSGKWKWLQIQVDSIQYTF